MSERKHRLLITDTIDDAGLEILRKSGEVEIVYEPGLTGEALLEAVSKAEAMITRSGTAVTPELLEAGENLRVVARAGVGLDNVDVAAATARGVLVINTPTANIISATEHTMGLMLSVLRNIPEADGSVRRGEWTRSKFTGRELYGKKLGIIGFGRIGSRVAKRARSFDAEILACDPYIAESVAERAGARYVDLDELLVESDIITVHTPLTDETRGMLGADEIAKMKDGVVVLNVARGGIYDETALAEALEQGRVAAAGIDVFAEEPPPEDHPLLNAPNVCLTPHLGANTTEAQERVATQTAEMLLEALRGSLFVSAVNLPVEGEIDQELMSFASLAEHLGSLAIQIAETPATKMSVGIQGIESRMLRMITVAALRGILTPHLSETVNFVNAEAIAERRGIEWSATIHEKAADYVNLVKVRVRTQDGEIEVAGTLFAGGKPRVVAINDYPVEFAPRGWVVYLVNRDVPGVVGKVGTILGDREINIAEYNLARSEKDGKALAIITVDSALDDTTLQFLRSSPAIETVRLIQL